MNTKGWDTIDLIKTESINQTLENKWNTFNKKFKGSDIEYNFFGEFAPFKIVNGGSNKLLRFSIPIKSGSLTIHNHESSDESKGAEYDLTNSECVVEIMLDFFNAKNNQKQLKINPVQFAKSKKDITDNQSNWITPIKFTGNCPDLYGNVMLELICKYLMDNPLQINQIFASIMFSQNNCKWTTPVKCKYSYLDSTPSYMGILSVCSKGKSSDLPIDIDLVSSKSNSENYFIISQELLNLNIIVPSLINLFANSKTSDYKVNNHGSLVNTCNINMKGVKSGAITYYPIIKQLEVSVLDDNIVINMNGTCNLKAGISMTFNGNVKIKPKFQNNTICFETIGTPTFKHDEEIPWYLNALLSPVINLITIIIISCIDEDLTNSFMHTFSNGIKMDNISAVKWLENTSDMKINNIQLNNSFIIEYNLK
ncbi:MAG: TULIP family P47-like protein [Rikenellaceae bacterium]